MAHVVFVYGTLRRGGVRAIPTLFPTAQFLGSGTVKGWLYDFGAYPGFLPDAHGLDVRGEVYTVDDAAMREMDEIERYVEGDAAECYYFRRRHIIALQDGRAVVAELYECNPRYYDCSKSIDTTDWIVWAQAKDALPEETWPDGAPIKK
jgi:gamma-glutamylcyclotransferase (GGCT)/AIG2-like uncharacterized protein YtfP